MRNRRLPALLLTAFAISPAFGADGDPKPAIGGLDVRVDSDRAIVSFRVENGLTGEALERIHSGIPVTFRHKVDLLARRSFPLIPAKLISRTLIETRAEYDPLTQQYSLLRTVTIRPRRKKLAPAPQESKRVTAETDEMRAWMTEFSDVSVADPGRELVDRSLKVRVDSALGRRYVLLIFPDKLSASAEFKLGP